MQAETNQQVAIREARLADGPELNRVAELDSRRVPSGHLLVAEVDGRIRAAIAVEDRELIADPFVATVPLQDLLRLRVAQMGQRRRALRRKGLLDGLKLRPGMS